MNKDWITETNGVIENIEGKRQRIQNRIELLAKETEQLTKELENLNRKIKSGQELIAEYVSMHNIVSSIPENIKIGELATKSYTDMVINLGKQTPGIITLEDATKVIYEVVGGNYKTVKHSIGNALTRSPHFTRIGRGQYRFTNHIQEKPSSKIKHNLSHRIRTKSGVEQVIKQLKESDPQITKKEVLARLNEFSFNFGGKNPEKAINMVWGKLGYSKENKQQPLPLERSN